MAKPKSPDRFRVGQVALLVLDKNTGHERRNGHRVTVVRQRVWGEWHCSDPLSSRPAETCTGWRYGIRMDEGGHMNVEQNMLRQIYDGEMLSTWAKFAKLTGLRLDKQLELVPAKPIRPKTRASA